MDVVETNVLALEAHRRSVRTPLNEVVGALQELISRQLLAFMVDVDVKTITRWANGEIDDIRSLEKEKKLRAAYEISILLQSVDSISVARAWFIGLNPELDDLSPIEGIRHGKLRDVRAAALSFVVGG